MPGDISGAESGRLYALIMSIIPDWFTEYYLRKLGHFSEYFVLGLLLRHDFATFIKPRQIQQFKNNDIIFVPAITAWIIAFLDETIQLFVPERAGLIADVWIDFSGAFLAIILTYVMIVLRDKKRHK